ncbi:MAG TPA: hypothetical protein VM163_02405, partial [bacterium]|nr:hypothetical protein [bacterium]
MRYLTVLLVFAFMFVVAVTGQADSFWPMFQRDPGHTGLAPVATADDMELLWQRDVWAFGLRSDSHL